MFRERKFKDKVATGVFTLPVTAALAMLLWVSPDVTDGSLWLGLAAVGLIAYLLVELNNRHSLLRIRSRMVSSSYLVMMTAAVFLHPLSWNLLPAFCLAAAYFPLFAAYQRPYASGQVYHAFLLLGIGSLCRPPLLLLAAGFYVALALPLRALSWRTFLSGLFGLATPYWIGAGTALWQNRLDAAADRFFSAFRFDLVPFAAHDIGRTTTAAFVAVLALLSTAHFLRTAFNDKIRVRMFFYTIIQQEVLLLTALVLLPGDFDLLLALLAVNTAPLVGHYFALARGRWFNVWFMCCLAASASLIVFNMMLVWKT